MSNSHTRVFEYAEELMSVPRAHLSLELLQNENGLTLLHNDQPLVECALTKHGMMAAGFMTKALGVKIPPLNQQVRATVSTGVLYRAVSIASLDFGNEESYLLLERLLEEAEMQRGGSSDAS